MTRKKRKLDQISESDHGSAADSADDTFQAPSYNHQAKRRAPAVELLDHRQAVSLPQQMELVMAHFAELKQSFDLFDGFELEMYQTNPEFDARSASVLQTLSYVQELLKLTDLTVDLEESESDRLQFRLLQYRLCEKETRKTSEFNRAKARELEAQLAAAKAAEHSRHTYMRMRSEKERLQQLVTSLQAENAGLRLQNATLNARSTLLSEQLTAQQNANAQMSSKLESAKIVLERHIVRLWHTVNSLYSKWGALVAGKQLSGSVADINSAIDTLHTDSKGKFDMLCNAYVQRNQPVPQLYLFASTAVRSLQESAGTDPAQSLAPSNASTAPSYVAG